MLKEQNVELLAASRIAYTLVYFPQENLSPVIHEQKFSFILKENILTIQIFCSTGVILHFETTKYEPFIKYCRSLFFTNYFIKFCIELYKGTCTNASTGFPMMDFPSYSCDVSIIFFILILLHIVLCYYIYWYSPTMGLF